MLNIKQGERLVELYYQWLDRDTDLYDFSRFLKIITFLSIHGLFNEDKAKAFLAEADTKKEDAPQEIEVMEKFYVVTKNDWPKGYKHIADRYGVNVDDLLRVNNLTWDDLLTPGQKLWIPKRKEA